MRRALLAFAFCLLTAAATAQSIPFPGPGGVSSATPTTLDPATLTGSASLSGGNLSYNANTTASVVRSSKFAATKFYVEFSVTTGASASGNFAVGVIDSSQATATPTSIVTVTAKMWLLRNDALALNNAASVGYGSNYGAGTTLIIAVDNTLGSGSGKIWIGTCSGGVSSWPASGNPATGANPMYSNLTGNIGLFINDQAAVAFAGTADFGGTAYACTPPSGFGNL